MEQIRFLLCGSPECRDVQVPTPAGRDGAEVVLDTAKQHVNADYERHATRPVLQIIRFSNMFHDWHFVISL